MKKITILEFPSNLGLTEPSPGHEPGVKKLPGWLKEHGFHEMIKASSVQTIAPPSHSMKTDKASGVKNADAIAMYAVEQAHVLNRVLTEKHFALVLGGDCSIMIGNMLALKQNGNYGLFYIDGHHDFMLSSLSGTEGAAGMDLAIVTGYGHDKLTNIQDAKPYVREEAIWCVGNREYDDVYVNPIIESDINYLDLPSLREKGMQACTDDFLLMVEKKGLDGFWIHLDVDVLDDHIMPAVDSRAPDGLSYDELDSLLSPLLAHPRVTGLEITILDPELDPDGRYTKEFVRRFCASFNQAIG